MACLPRFATPRDLSRPTLGGQVADIAVKLGYNPMPWQQQTWDVMYELDPDGSLHYSEARITVPRQSGKTTSTLARHVHRMVMSDQLGWGNRPLSIYTAQTASAARDKLVNEFEPVIAGSPLDDLVTKFVRSNGHEALSWSGGGRMTIVPPSRTGGHGYTIDLVDADEYFSAQDNRLEQAVRPAMITRFSPQIVFQSTAGTLESVPFREKVDDGRERVTSGADSAVCFFEWSADPEVDDVHNPDHWPRFMPALRTASNPQGTISIAAIQREHDALSEDDFLRAYCNVWTSTASRLIPAQAWAKCADAQSKIQGSLFLGVDASPTGPAGRAGSIAVSGWNAAGKVHCEIIANRPGVSWIRDEIYSITRKHSFDSLTIDANGPALSILPDIKAAANCKVEVTDAPTMGAAAARLLDGIFQDLLRYLPNPNLEAAVAGAAKRQLLDGFAFSRRHSQADLSPLVAVTLAHWQAATHPVQAPLRMYV